MAAGKIWLERDRAGTQLHQLVVVLLPTKEGLCYQRGYKKRDENDRQSISIKEVCFLSGHSCGNFKIRSVNEKNMPDRLLFPVCLAQILMGLNQTQFVCYARKKCISAKRR